MTNDSSFESYLQTDAAQQQLDAQRQTQEKSVADNEKDEGQQQAKKKRNRKKKKKSSASCSTPSSSGKLASFLQF